MTSCIYATIVQWAITILGITGASSDPWFDRSTPAYEQPQDEAYVMAGCLERAMECNTNFSSPFLGGTANVVGTTTSVATQAWYFSSISLNHLPGCYFEYPDAAHMNICWPYSFPTLTNQVTTNTVSLEPDISEFGPFIRAYDLPPSPTDGSQWLLPPYDYFANGAAWDNHFGPTNNFLLCPSGVQWSEFQVSAAWKYAGDVYSNWWSSYICKSNYMVRQWTSWISATQTQPWMWPPPVLITNATQFAEVTYVCGSPPVDTNAANGSYYPSVPSAPLVLGDYTYVGNYYGSDLYFSANGTCILDTTGAALFQFWGFGDGASPIIIDTVNMVSYLGSIPGELSCSDPTPCTIQATVKNVGDVFPSLPCGVTLSGCGATTNLSWLTWSNVYTSVNVSNINIGVSEYIYQWSIPLGEPDVFTTPMGAFTLPYERDQDTYISTNNLSDLGRTLAVQQWREVSVGQANSSSVYVWRAYWQGGFDTGCWECNHGNTNYCYAYSARGPFQGQQTNWSGSFTNGWTNAAPDTYPISGMSGIPGSMGIMTYCTWSPNDGTFTNAGGTESIAAYFYYCPKNYTVSNLTSFAWSHGRIWNGGRTNIAGGGGWITLYTNGVWVTYGVTNCPSGLISNAVWTLNGQWTVNPDGYYDLPGDDWSVATNDSFSFTIPYGANPDAMAGIVQSAFYNCIGEMIGGGYSGVWNTNTDGDCSSFIYTLFDYDAPGFPKAQYKVDFHYATDPTLFGGAR